MSNTRSAIEPGREALEIGRIPGVHDENLVRLIGVIRKAGINPVVCINRFVTDTKAECAAIRKATEAAGARCAESQHWLLGA